MEVRLMPLAETIMGGAIIGMLAGAGGLLVGRRGQVPEKTCEERRKSCTDNVELKLKHIKETVDWIKKRLED